VSYADFFRPLRGGSIEKKQFFYTFPLVSIAKKRRKRWMKAVERNISRHENGNLYFVARRRGRLFWRSLRTKDLAQARRMVREEGIKGLAESKAPKAAPSGSPSPEALHESHEILQKPNLPAVSISEALTEHDRGLILMSAGAEEMAARGRRVVERYYRDWDGFSPVEIWNSYRRSGVKLRGEEFTSAANHLRWYLRKFVPWAVTRGLVPAEVEEELARIPKIKVPPRRIRVPEPIQVDEFLRMVATEDLGGAAFLRFLAATGLRRGGACGLTWRHIDFAAGTMEVKQKGGRVKVIPLSPEALEVLQGRREFPRPWPYGIKELEVLERKMKRFAKGLDLDLTTFHSFRHYFASRALMAGLTVQEVADLLGHSDGGVLVLQTYGHICGERLKNAVSNLRLTA
jgi:integrase